MTDAEVSSTAPMTMRAFCSACAGSRNCEIRGNFSERGGEDNYDWHKAWYILECRGCEHVFALTVSTTSEDMDYYYDRNGNTESSYNETLEYWPAKAKRDRPAWIGEISLADVDVSPLILALTELYGALNGDLNGLAGTGVRTTFDVASELLGADPAITFEEKLSVLVKAGHIGSHDKSHIETLIDAGSASAHRGWRPSTTELKTMMDVLENFILQAFVEPGRRRKRDEEVQSLNVPKKQQRKKQPKVDPAAAAPTNDAAS